MTSNQTAPDNTHSYCDFTAENGDYLLIVGTSASYSTMPTSVTTNKTIETVGEISFAGHIRAKIVKVSGSGKVTTVYPSTGYTKWSYAFKIIV